jgi:hypothetical protein
MRTLILAAAWLVAVQSTPTPDGGMLPPVPVLLELFTSEGCSSCPPADALLSRLAREGVPGAQVIPLGLHVDYWDELGWKDPASSRQATVRQDAYARALGLGDRIYTPQLVVAGRREMVGTDEAAARRAIAKAASEPHAQIALAVDIDGDTLVAHATVSDIPAEASKEPIEARLAITEDDLTSAVKRGENTGRTLHHDAVVRTLASMGTVPGPGDLGQQTTLAPQWRRERLHAVVFLQGRKTQRIWGAATVRLTPVRAAPTIDR